MVLRSGDVTAFRVLVTVPTVPVTTPVQTAEQTGKQIGMRPDDRIR